MKLAKYLADYIGYEIEKYPRESGLPDCEHLIQQGIEAYVSTQNIDLLLIDGNGKEAESVWTVISCHGGVVEVKERASDRLKIMLHDYDIQDMDDTIHDYDQDEEGVYQEIEL